MNKRQAKKNWKKLLARISYSRRNREIVSIIDVRNVSVTSLDNKRPTSLRKWCK